MQIAGEFEIRIGGGFVVQTPGEFAANTQIGRGSLTTIVCKDLLN